MKKPIKKNSIRERAKKVPPEIKLFVQMQYDLIKEIDECIESCYCNGKIYKIEAGAFRDAKKIIQNYKPDFKKIRR